MMKIFIVSAFVLVMPFPSAAATPKLGVIIVVDQMRADYLERDPEFSGGFKRLAHEGAIFTEAEHLHIPTLTGPGHAAIATGRAPSTHGIVGNNWYDRATGLETYCVFDDAYGIGPSHLSGPTLPDAVKAANPKNRVFAIAGKDRSAVLLGGRRPDIALWLDFSKGVFTTSSYYQRPQWLDEFNAKLLGSGLWALRDGKITPSSLASSTVDAALEMLVTELVLRESVGQGPGTDLLLMSFSATDLVGHRYGLEGPEMTAQLKALDQIVGRVIDQLDVASHQSMVLALSSDHGAIPAPEDVSGQRLGVRRVSSDVLGSALESAFQKRWPSPKDKWILSSATPYLTMNRVLAAKRGLEWHDFLRETAAIVSHVDGVSQVYLTSEIPEMGPKVPFVTTVKRSLRLDRAGDLIVILNENVLMYDKPTGTGHGTPWSYDALVPLVFWGKGIPAERFETPASPMDIAPTLGRLLGINYPAADGGALRNEIFK